MIRKHPVIILSVILCVLIGLYAVSVLAPFLSTPSQEHAGSGFDAGTLSLEDPPEILSFVLPDHFKIDGQYAYPHCFMSFRGDLKIDLRACGDRLRALHDAPYEDGAFIRMDYSLLPTRHRGIDIPDDPAHHFFIRYKYVGPHEDGHVIYVESNMETRHDDNRAPATRLFLIEHDSHNDMLSVARIYGFGTQCNGGISYAHITADHDLEYGVYVTPNGLQNMPGCPAPVFDPRLDSCPDCCLGLSHFRNDALRYVELTVTAQELTAINKETPDLRPQQKCFNEQMIAFLSRYEPVMVLDHVTAFMTGIHNRCEPPDDFDRDEFLSEEERSYLIP